MGRDKAKCRGCGKELIGDDYCYGGSAYEPGTLKSCKVNHYGGFVCSCQCDRSSSYKLENSMPGACPGGNRSLSPYASRSLSNNWED